MKVRYAPGTVKMSPLLYHWRMPGRSNGAFESESGDLPMKRSLSVIKSNGDEGKVPNIIILLCRDFFCELSGFHQLLYLG